MDRRQIAGVAPWWTRAFAALVVGLSMSSTAFADEEVAIKQFTSRGAAGEQVVTPLPIYKLHVQNGVLVDENGKIFNSHQPQTTVSPADSKCKIPPEWWKRGWKAYFTTFYVVRADDPDHILAVKSCGKSPLKKDTDSQYENISDSNFINHAQIAGTTDGKINKVIAAGEMDVVDGRIVYIDTCSGHFLPTVGSLLAYMRTYAGNAVGLTSRLKSIGSSITEQQIKDNFTPMVGGEDPLRNVRTGTKDCNSYTTVFEARVSGDTTVLSGGLLTLNGGNAQVFQSSMNAITNRNVKSVDLRKNKGLIYNYAAWVVTDWHIFNDNLEFNFSDETNDTYKLFVLVYSYDHEVDYNSDKPNINKILITKH